MIKDNRVIYDDNGTKTDYSSTLAQIETGTVTVAIVALEDYIYIGSTYPFNHRYISVSTANTNSSVLSVDIYDGSVWNGAVDVIDKTSVAGKTFAQSGVVQFSVDRSKSWSRISTTESISVLSSFKIYDKYWARLRFSANFSAGTAIKYVGHAFSADGQLAMLYPDLNSSNLKTAFASGKTTWEEQHVLAGDKIIEDLQNSGMVVTGNQIMNWERYTQASLHCVAAMVYRAFGDDYKDNLEQAVKDYKEAINKAIGDIDKNADGVLSIGEQFAELKITRR